jgi:hypothetical protein
MSKDVKVSKIEIETEEGKLLLTVDQAKKLFKDLNELFGEKVINIPSTPIIIERDCWPYRPYYAATGAQTLDWDNYRDGAVVQLSCV